jgi:hypothetical protein
MGSLPNAFYSVKNCFEFFPGSRIFFLHSLFLQGLLPFTSSSVVALGQSNQLDSLSFTFLLAAL